MLDKYFLLSPFNRNSNLMINTHKHVLCGVCLAMNVCVIVYKISEILLAHGKQNAPVSYNKPSSGSNQEHHFFGGSMLC